MTHPAPIRPLRTPAVRRAVLAPDIERYLSRKNVDLLVTDQVQALQVRVRRGIEVLERKVEAGRKRARQLGIGLAAAVLCGISVLVLHAVAWARGRTSGSQGAASEVLWTLALIVAGLTLASAIALVRVILDARELTKLAGRHTGGHEQARTAEEVLDFAGRALEDARALGAVPSDPPDGARPPEGLPRDTSPHGDTEI
ncbi:MAG TPA: hypothetical protein VMT52_17060 [Planctomycetota bacterium]|nr:hypothetical protein [Planctomycetota bacterium]